MEDSRSVVCQGRPAPVYVAAFRSQADSQGCGTEGIPCGRWCPFHLPASRASSLDRLILLQMLAVASRSGPENATVGTVIFNVQAPAPSKHRTPIVAAAQPPQPQ